MSIKLSTPDLTQHPPRSPRARLGGFVILPRALDKGRATIAGKNGEYHYNCPLDKRFLTFAGIDGDALLAELRKGKGDGEILEWVKTTSTVKPTTEAIAQWSAQNEQRGPADPEAKEKLAKQVAGIAPNRRDIERGFDFLELDDYVTFGGVP